MKQLCVPFLALFCVTALAQPVLNSAEMLPPGNTTYMRQIATWSAVDTTLQGANMTWNYTGLSVDMTQPEFIYTIMDPAATPHSGLFAADNYAWWEQPSDQYRFFTLTPTFMQRVGSYGSGPYVMADPQIEYVFPLTYGTTNTDTWYGQSDGGTYSLKCVGYGSLTLPGITFQDVLMVRAKVTSQFYSFNAYFWYSSQDGRILLQVINSPIIQSGVFFDAVASSVQDGQSLQATVLNNPVTNELRFTLGEQATEVEYSILSNTGALLGQGRVQGAPGTMNIVSTEHLASGLYVLQLTRSGQASSAALRFVKE